MVKLEIVVSYVWHQSAHNSSQRWLVLVAVVSMMQATSDVHDAGDVADGRPYPVAVVGM